MVRQGDSVTSDTKDPPRATSPRLHACRSSSSRSNCCADSILGPAEPEDFPAADLPATWIDRVWESVVVGAEAEEPVGGILVLADLPMGEEAGRGIQGVARRERERARARGTTGSDYNYKLFLIRLLIYYGYDS